MLRLVPGMAVITSKPSLFCPGYRVFLKLITTISWLNLTAFYSYNARARIEDNTRVANGSGRVARRRWPVLK